MKYLVYEGADKSTEIIAEIDGDKLPARMQMQSESYYSRLGFLIRSQTCYCMLPALSELHSGRFLLTWQAT